MYLREKRIKWLKMKNIIFLVMAIFNIGVSVAVLVNLISVYWGDAETILYAKATPESILSIFTGTLLLIMACKSRNYIGDAHFYSSYFEGDLDGYVTYADLAEVTGKKEHKIKKQLHLFRKLYMKNYELQEVNHVEQVVLKSKKYTCECKNCGALIEKRSYFTGVCSYCQSSDLFAKVLMDNRFYSIDSTLSAGIKRPDFYLLPKLQAKRTLFVICLTSGLGVIFLAMVGLLENIGHYGDKEYLTELLLSGEGSPSFELIKKDIIENIIWLLVMMLALLPVIYHWIKNVQYVNTANSCAGYFAKSKKPFVEMVDLPDVKKSKNKKTVNAIRGALRRRYLLNCTMEMHDGTLQMALAKKIVKDKCPSCNGPIVGAVDEHYKCRYCGNMIMNVVRKK